MFSWASNQLEKLTLAVAPPPNDPVSRFLFLMQKQSEEEALDCVRSAPDVLNVVIQPTKGSYAIHLACQNSMIRLVQYILSLHPMVGLHATDAMGNTVLHYAALSQRTDQALPMCRMLVTDFGASVLMKNTLGQTPYDVATLTSVRQFLLPLQLQQETQQALDNGGVGLPPGIDLGGLRIQTNTAAVYGAPPTTTAMMMMSSSSSGAIPNVVTTPQSQPPPNCNMFATPDVSSPPQYHPPPAVHSNTNNHSYGNNYIAPAPASLPTMIHRPPNNNNPTTETLASTMTESSSTTTHREYARSGSSSAALDSIAQRNSGKSFIRPDGFHSSSSDVNLQKKYGHVPIAKTVPPPPLSGNAGLPIPPMSGGGGRSSSSGGVADAMPTTTNPFSAGGGIALGHHRSIGSSGSGIGRRYVVYDAMTGTASAPPLPPPPSVIVSAPNSASFLRNDAATTTTTTTTTPNFSIFSPPTSAMAKSSSSPLWTQAQYGSTTTMTDTSASTHSSWQPQSIPQSLGIEPSSSISVPAMMTAQPSNAVPSSWQGGPYPNTAQLSAWQQPQQPQPETNVYDAEPVEAQQQPPPQQQQEQAWLVGSYEQHEQQPRGDVLRPSEFMSTQAYSMPQQQPPMSKVTTTTNASAATFFTQPTTTVEDMMTSMSDPPTFSPAEVFFAPPPIKHHNSTKTNDHDHTVTVPSMNHADNDVSTQQGASFTVTMTGEPTMGVVNQQGEGEEVSSASHPSIVTESACSVEGSTALVTHPNIDGNALLDPQNESTVAATTDADGTVIASTTVSSESSSMQQPPRPDPVSLIGSFEAEERSDHTTPSSIHHTTYHSSAAAADFFAASGPVSVMSPESHHHHDHPAGVSATTMTDELSPTPSQAPASQQADPVSSFKANDIGIFTSYPVAPINAAAADMFACHPPASQEQLTTLSQSGTVAARDFFNNGPAEQSHGPSMEEPVPPSSDATANVDPKPPASEYDLTSDPATTMRSSGSFELQPQKTTPVDASSSQVLDAAAATSSTAVDFFASVPLALTPDHHQFDGEPPKSEYNNNVDEDNGNDNNKEKMHNSVINDEDFDEVSLSPQSAKKQQVFAEQETQSEPNAITSEASAIPIASTFPKGAESLFNAIGLPPPPFSSNR